MAKDTKGVAGHAKAVALKVIANGHTTGTTKSKDLDLEYQMHKQIQASKIQQISSVALPGCLYSSRTKCQPLRSGFALSRPWPGVTVSNSGNGRN